MIPVFNEAQILASAVTDLRERLNSFEYSVEIILAENGSRDGTQEIAGNLARSHPEVRVLGIPEPNYGRALREGILAARGEWVVCDEIDLCDTDFYRAAVAILARGQAEFVVGSKLLGGSRDARPWVRHAASLAYTALLRALLGFRGTDTHGVKAFVRSRLDPVVRMCVVDKDVFSSELVIRAYRSGVRITEIPVHIAEKRPPSINLLKRVPNVLGNLGRLTWAIRIGGR